MVHTCYASRPSESHFFTALSAEERENLRSEDGVSAFQLKAFMAEYKRMKKMLAKLSLDDFWKRWWTAVDRIPPQLPPEDVCCRTADGNGGRDVQVVLVLEQAGYEGMDFDEIIPRHFRKFRRDMAVPG
jgi:hypothetical protein